MLKNLLPAVALVVTTAFLTQALLTPTGHAAQDDGDDPPAGGFDAAAMMEVMALTQPGPEHEQLMAQAGSWEQVVTMNMPPIPGMPATPPMRQTIEVEQTAVLGGRFLMSESSGSMMGMPVEQLGFVGFDRRTSEYITVGLDTLGTYFVTGRGPMGEDGIVRMHGEDPDPSGKQVYTFEVENISADEYRMRVLFSEMGGMKFDEPFAMVTIHATRKDDE